MAAVETPPEIADPAVPAEVETQVPPADPVVEDAAPPEEPAAAGELQVEAAPTPPSSLTREEIEALVESKAEKIRADEREAERRRRQTEGARRAAAEKRESEERADLRDQIRAAFIEEQGMAPPTEKIEASIDRFVRKRADQLTSSSLDTVDQAFDYIVAPIYGQSPDLDDSFEPAARRLAPKVQAMINAMRPQIEAKAREGYIAESELPKRVEAEIARRAAKGREGQTELVRPEGVPSVNDNSSIADRLDRIGTARETPADRQWWNEREKARGRG